MTSRYTHNNWATEVKFVLVHMLIVWIRNGNWTYKINSQPASGSVI